jgi:predicted Rossmann fold flavoprotein
MMNIEETIWDVVVIGGGASGMMSAGVAGSLGKKVLLLEKNEELGKKLLITGGGRCNVTNNEPDVRKFLSKYKDSDKFLFSTFSQFSVKDALDFFNSRGMETKVEALGRVFPVSNSAKTVWETLLNNLKKTSVNIASNCPVTSIEKNGDRIISVTLKDKRIINAKSFIIATGGKSHPETGSTGDGFKWLKDLGHTVTEPTASLVPIAVKNEETKKLQGVSVEEVKITILQNDAKQEVKRGKILFTHFGLSGPTILNLAGEVGELLKYGEVFISLDILPNLDPGQLNEKLQEIFKENSNKKLKNCLDTLMPSAVVPVVIELSKIVGEKAVNSVTREERLKLVDQIKNIKLEVDSLLDESKAIVTSGGVSLEEVDFKTMTSKLYPNLFLTGDILNIDRPSGGYSLQLCWSTGYVAGMNS